jgi:hypothetical protein
MGPKEGVSVGTFVACWQAGLIRYAVLSPEGKLTLWSMVRHLYIGRLCFKLSELSAAYTVLYRRFPEYGSVSTVFSVSVDIFLLLK